MTTKELKVKLSSGSSSFTGNFQIFAHIEGTPDTIIQIETAVLDDGSGDPINPASPDFYFDRADLEIGLIITVDIEVYKIVVKSNTVNCTNSVEELVSEDCLVYVLYDAFPVDNTVLTNKVLPFCNNVLNRQYTDINQITYVDIREFMYYSGPEPVDNQPSLTINMLLYDARPDGFGIDLRPYFQCNNITIYRFKYPPNIPNVITYNDTRASFESVYGAVLATPGCNLDGGTGSSFLPSPGLVWIKAGNVDIPSEVSAGFIGDVLRLNIDQSQPDAPFFNVAVELIDNLQGP
jgi:hypothetical protein